MPDVQITDNSGLALELMARAKKNALTAIGIQAEGHAKEYEMAVDTGRLRNSITHAEDDEAAYIGTNVEYAPYIELGARGRAPLHFLQQAAANHTEEYKEIIEAAMRSAE